MVRQLDRSAFVIILRPTDINLYTGSLKKSQFGHETDSKISAICVYGVWYEEALSDRIVRSAGSQDTHT